MTHRRPVTEATAAAQLALAGDVVEIYPALAVGGVHVALGAHGLAQTEAVELGESGDNLLLGEFAGGLRAPAGEHLVGVVAVVVMVVLVLMAVLVVVLVLMVVVAALVVPVLMVMVVPVVVAAALFAVTLIRLGGEALEL